MLESQRRRAQILIYELSWWLSASTCTPTNLDAVHPIHQSSPCHVAWIRHWWLIELPIWWPISQPIIGQSGQGTILRLDKANSSFNCHDQGPRSFSISIPHSLISPQSQVKSKLSTAILVSSYALMHWPCLAWWNRSSILETESTSIL